MSSTTSLPRLIPKLLLATKSKQISKMDLTLPQKYFQTYVAATQRFTTEKNPHKGGKGETSSRNKRTRKVHHEKKRGRRNV